MTTISQRKTLLRVRRAEPETLDEQAVRLFPDSDYAPAGTVQHNRAAWMAAVLYLGDKWLGKVHAKRDTIALAVAGSGALPILVFDIVQKVTT